MRFRKLSKWDDPCKQVALIYFAQILDEMLFDFSLATYKASVMNSGLLCVEALQTIDEVEAGNIKSPNVQHVTAELCTNLGKDRVAQALLPLPAEAFFAPLKNPKTPLREIRQVVEVLAEQLSASKYRKKNEELLVAEICGGQSISEVRRLARNYVTTLISIGFSQKFLQEVVLQFFYYGSNRISGPEAINDFIALFPKDKADFSVIFRVDKIFENLIEAFSPLDVQITTTLPSDIDLSKFQSFTPSGEQRIYAIVSKISARDIYNARASAEQRLKLCSTVLSIFHHKDNPNWLPQCVVRRTEDEQCNLVTKPINSMHKCTDLVQTVARKHLQLFLSNFSLELDSFAKFLRSTQLHSMALGSGTEENQILNLWIALESLVPSESKSEDVSNIEHIVGSLMPFLNFGYIERLLNNLVKDLLRWNAAATKKALKAVPGRKFTDKLAKLIVLPDYEQVRDELEAAFRDFHLLRDRFCHFRNILASPEKLIEALDAHKLRLEWQIRRIYRTRNIIVHSGHTPGYVHPLIEHTHDYLDTVLSSLVKLASKPKLIDSVGQGFKLASLQYATYYKKLSEKGLSFTAENMDALLFNR